MADFVVRVYRPVALPQKFFGAPALPAFFNFTTAVLLFMAAANFNFFFPPLPFFTGLLAHFFIMMWGARDPHLSTLIQSGHKARRKPRTFGRRSQTHTFEP